MKNLCRALFPLLFIAALPAHVHAVGQAGPPAPMPCFVTTAPPTYTTGFAANCSMTTGGAIRVDASVNAIQGFATAGAFSGSNGVAVGGIFGGLWYPLQLDMANGNLKTITAAAATGGATAGNEIVPNNTTGINLKASSGTVYGIQLSGIGAAPAILKLYNKATAPTCGTDTPIKRLIIPANATAALGAGSNISFPVGIAFSLGIGYCVTTGISDADTTAPPANTFLVNIDWN